MWRVCVPQNIMSRRVTVSVTGVVRPCPLQFPGAASVCFVNPRAYIRTPSSKLTLFRVTRCWWSEAAAPWTLRGNGARTTQAETKAAIAESVRNALATSIIIDDARHTEQHAEVRGCPSAGAVEEFDFFVVRWSPNLQPKPLPRARAVLL